MDISLKKTSKKIDNKYSIIDNMIFFLYSIYFILFPFYFWDSGLPQLSDFIIVLLLIIRLIQTKMKLQYISRAKSFLIVGLFFITYVTFSNLIWMILINESERIGIVPLYYIYNFINSILVISLYTEYKEKILEIIYKATVISILCQMIIFIMSGGFTGSRMIIGFNNPNQLGYYALITTSVLIILSNKIIVKSFWFFLAIISNALLIIASLSSTAIISYIGLIICFIFSKMANKRLKRNTILLMIVILPSILILYKTTNIFTDNVMIQGLKNRALTVERKTKGIVEDRGYNRITEYPEYWILGAGEGAYLQRFGITRELHSTLGNIQVSYGIVGLLLFLRFLYLALKNKKFTSWYVIFFILVYGITHNGIRSSLFWILLGLIVLE